MAHNFDDEAKLRKLAYRANHGLDEAKRKRKNEEIAQLCVCFTQGTSVDIT